MDLSVCIITYNHESFIEQALKSVLEQDVDFDYEIVVGEDCSTDSTADRLRKIEMENPDRVRIISNKTNIGSRANFNQTLAACRGEYIAFLEGDDFWTAKKKLQLQVDFLRNRAEASCVFHRAQTMNHMDPSSERVIPPLDPPESSGFDFVLQDNNPIALSSLVARRACLVDIDVWLADIKPGDWLISMMLATKGRIGFIPLQMSVYRVHAAGYWTRLSPLHRVALSVRTLMHAARLVDGKERELVEQRSSQLSEWWGAEFINNDTIAIDSVIDELGGIGDFRLSGHLLGRAARVARINCNAQRWHEEQAKAWEVTALRNFATWSNSVSENKHLWSTIQEQDSRIGELSALTTRSAEQIREQEVAITTLNRSLARSAEQIRDLKSKLPFWRKVWG